MKFTGTLSLRRYPRYLSPTYTTCGEVTLVGVITTRFTKTRPAVAKIGERAKPDPKGRPGYIRTDTIHQGDMNGDKKGFIPTTGRNT